MRELRFLLGLLFTGVILLLLAAAGVWWWAGTEGSAQWALQQAAKREPLVAEGVRGSLRNGMEADRIAWNRDGLHAEARQVQLARQPR